MYLTTPEQDEWRRTVRAMCEDKLVPNAAAVDRDAAYPWESHKAFVNMGIMGMTFPEEFGGQGADEVTWAITMEEVSRVCASSSLIPLICNLGMLPVIHYASDDIKSRTLPLICDGTHQASYCLSEAEAGSDVVRMKARAVRDGDEWVLNGRKMWITNAGVSHFYTVFAKTDPEGGHRGVSAFLVTADMPGFAIGKLEDKLGIRGSPTGEVILEDVRVPDANVIGEVGRGFYYAMRTFDRARPTVGAQAVGIAQGAFDVATSYMKERSTFGTPLTEHQGLQFMVADMAMAIEAARLLVYEACHMVDVDHPRLTEVASMAKCYAGDVAMSVTTDAVQLLGGYVYVKDFPVERMMRDAKITQIYEGTNQIQRMVVARQVLS